ncbi:endo-1,4-beta-xylanase [Candidatus Poribacteria bacterium]|nr:endo-1,4-beta-xylanase [Candidatus Poribacteria bacterium]
MTRVQQNIERYRKGEAVLHLRGAEGRPLPEVDVSVQQDEHDFRFGCNLNLFDRFETPRENEKYKQYFARLFNYATIGFDEPESEPERDVHTDEIVAWCQTHRITMKGGLCVTTPSQRDSVRKQIAEVVARYKGAIDHWEVVSEPTPFLNQVELVKRCYQWARQAYPEAKLILTGRDVMAGEETFNPFLCEIKVGDPADKASGEVTPIDMIGIQIHEPLGTRPAPAKVLRTLDRYATWGLPIHITQLALPSDGRPIRDSWKQGTWTEREQADYAVALYTICFSYPNVEAISWADLSDPCPPSAGCCPRGRGLGGASQEGCGLLRAKLYTKRIYKILRKLIHTEWQTRTSGGSDEKGDFCFRGFYGHYHVTVIAPNNVLHTATIHLTQGGNRDFTITLA